ncbi:MAG: class I SAM-dependent methyltransferase [Nanoarchaeota archaeon]
MTSRGKHKRIYEKRAKAYELLMSIVGYNSALKGILANMPLEIKNNAKILDLGCGTGLATGPLAKKLPRAEITGLDFSEEMLKIYESNFPNSKLIIGDFNDEKTFRLYSSGDSVKLPNSYFDLIISTGALSEYGYLDKAIPFVYSKLKKNGVLINIGVNDTLLSKLTGFFWGYKTAGKKKFFGACRDCGFAEVKHIRIPFRFFPNNYWRYIAKARK